MENQWYFSKDGDKQEGPISQDGLENLFNEGKLSSKTLVWSPSLSNWTKITDVPELSLKKIAIPPPLPALNLISPELKLIKPPTLTKPPVTTQKSQNIRIERQNLQEHLEIKPKRKVLALFLILACVGMSVLALWMMAQEEAGEGELIVGLICLLFFGWYGLTRSIKAYRRNTSLVLTPEHLEIISIYGKSKIPWDDVEKVDVHAQMIGGQLVGIRLKTYENYLENMSDEMADALMKDISYGKLFLGLNSLIKAPKETEPLLKAFGIEESKKLLQDQGSIRNLVDMLIKTREKYGFDLFFTFWDLDRSATAFSRLLRKYI